MKGEADWTGAVNVFFVLAFTKQLIMIRHIMKFILRREYLWRPVQGKSGFVLSF